ncbi:MAG: hypothetical protein A2W85_09165 [Bacteroidetes bacterium GWF2_41_31]|nr:MAG: hypothetical protein A2W85_09165 [Bacteroidetes bacterium GWF2_41_31]
MAVKLTRAPVPDVWWFILPMAVWVVYTLDHLFDSIKLKGKAISARHQFHYLHAKILTIAVFCFGILTLAMSILYFQKQVILYSLALAGLVVVYFAAINILSDKWRMLIPKELVIAVVYVTGIWFVPLWFSTQTISGHLIIILLLLTLLVWSEGTIASWFEYDDDVHDGNHSFATTSGLIRGKSIIFVVLISVLIFLPGLTFLSHQPAIKYGAMLLLAIDLGLLAILLLPGYFSRNSRYRMIGESLFFIPSLMVLF